MSDAPDDAAGATEPVAVTLLTGDTVHWVDSGDGNAYVEDIEQAPRDYPAVFDQSGTQDDFYVIPDDVMNHVVSGSLDEELFNIPSLIRQGLDDESTGGELPVIVIFDEQAEGKQLESDANALPAVSKAQGIEAIQGAGVKVNRGKASQFREAVLAKSDERRGPSTHSQSDSLDGAVNKIILDQMLEIDLSESVPQIGAPQAWDAGYTGEGVTVAVLDTGVDTTHPDLAGQVAAAATFVDSPAFAVDQLDEPLPYIGMEAAAPVPSSGSSDPLVHVGRACVDSEGDELLRDPAGKTALIARDQSACTFAEKYDAAVDAGAAAVVVYNDEPGVVNGTIAGAEHAGEVWAAGISDTAGAALTDLLDAGEPVVLEFTPGFVGDDHGHGTHVASTIAGTGAASDGARRGVAPDANLLSGKVCDSQGDCPTSAIMAAMEWATEQGADIVNMSLGTDSPSDGTDVMSQLVNQLSAETGTLFVTAAGNAGGFARVGSPAAADAALAVGAVDKDDQMASFSSRGPRLGDHAVKPEITAPGVGIVAARAAGAGLGDVVDEHYTSLNGTSMASPHVAGAAALLTQARGLSGQELKDALVSTAADGGHLWFEQGAGRVDIPAALDSPVYAQGTVNFADVDAEPEQELTYINRSDSDVTLSLEAAATNISGQAVGGVGLSSDTLAVPAGGQATVTVTVTSAEVSGTGPFGGVVTATGDGVDLRTPIGFGQPEPTVTIEVLDSNGDRVGSDTAEDVRVSLFHDSADWDVDPCCSPRRIDTSDGVATGRVKPGIYTLITTVQETDPDIGDLPRSSILVELEVAIRANTSVTLDARDAVPVRVTVPQEADKRQHEVGLVRGHPNPHPLVPNRTDYTVVEFGWHFDVYVTPTPPSKMRPGYIGLLVGWTLAEPQPLHLLPGADDNNCEPPTGPADCYSPTPAYFYNLAFLYANGIPENLHETVAHRDLVKVPSVYHHENRDALLARDERIMSSIFPSQAWTGGSRGGQILIEPGEVTEYYSANDGVSWARGRVQRDPADRAISLNQVQFDRFPAAEAGATRTEEHWFQAPLRTGVPDAREEYLEDPAPGFVPEPFAVRGGRDGNEFWQPRYVVGNVRGALSGGLRRNSFRMWNLHNGAELAGFPFRLAVEEATYRLQVIEEPLREGAGVGDLLRTAEAVTTDWTFTSRPSDARVPDGHECTINDPQEWFDFVCQIQPLINLEYDLGLDINNRAPAGRQHASTITAGHHSKAIDRAKVTDLSVQASFDDGQTWTDAQVVSGPTDTTETGGFLRASAPYQAFEVELDIPPLADTNGFVALRVQAEDANGGTVDQTIHRAYILKEADDGGNGEVSFASLRELVSSFAADGDVTRRGEHRLLRSVDLADRFADRGQTVKAIKLLEEFQELAGDSKLVMSEAAKDALIGAAEWLIASLLDTSGGSGSGGPGRSAKSSLTAGGALPI